MTADKMALLALLASMKDEGEQAQPTLPPPRPRAYPSAWAPPSTYTYKPSEEAQKAIDKAAAKQQRKAAKRKAEQAKR